MTIPATYISCVVRMWRDKSLDTPESPAGWQGEVEHIQTGQRYTFETLDELLDCLRRLTEDCGTWGDLIEN